MAPTFALGRAIPPKRTVEFALSPGVKKTLMALGAAGGTAAAAKMGRDAYKNRKEDGLQSRIPGTVIGGAIGLAGGAALGKRGKGIAQAVADQGRRAAESLVSIHSDLVRNSGMSPDEAARTVKRMTETNPGLVDLPRQVREGMKADKMVGTIIPATAGLGAAGGAAYGLGISEAMRKERDMYAQSALAGQGYVDPEGDSPLSADYAADKKVPLSQRKAAVRAFMERDSKDPMSYGRGAAQGSLALAPLGALLGLESGGRLSAAGGLAGAGVGAGIGAGMGLLGTYLENKERKEFSDALERGDEKTVKRMVDENFDFYRGVGRENPARLRRGSKKRQEYLKSSMKKQGSAKDVESRLFRLILS